MQDIFIETSKMESDLYTTMNKLWSATRSPVLPVSKPASIYFVYKACVSPKSY